MSRLLVLFSFLIALPSCRSVLGFGEPTRDDAGGQLGSDASEQDASLIDASLIDAQPGPAAALQFRKQPSVAAAGAVMVPGVEVVIVDSQGVRVPTDDVVSLELTPNPTTATLNGEVNVVAVNGVATFSNLRIDEIGTGYGLRATSGALTAANSGAFEIAGLFSAPQVITVGTDPRGVRVADVNGDGRNDIVVSHRLAEIQIRYGSAATPRTFGTPTVINSGAIPNKGLQIGDVDHDGKVDLVITTLGDTDSVGSVRAALQGSTAGTFSPPVAILSNLTGPSLPYVRDLNGDGRVDIALATSTTKFTVATHSPTTAGSYSTAEYDAGLSYVYRVVAGDYTNDGRLDLLMCAQGAGAAGYWSQTSTGAYGQGPPGYPGGDGVGVVDLQNDGAIDMITLGSSKVYLHQSQPGSLGTHVTDGTGINAGYAAVLVGSGDWNRDGHTDLVVGGGAELVLLMQDASMPGKVLPKQTVDDLVNITDLEVVDLDHDGKLDVVTVTAAGALRIVWGQ